MLSLPCWKIKSSSLKEGWSFGDSGKLAQEQQAVLHFIALAGSLCLTFVDSEDVPALSLAAEAWALSVFLAVCWPRRAAQNSGPGPAKEAAPEAAATREIIAIRRVFMDMMDLSFGAKCGDLRLTSTLPIIPRSSSQTLTGHRTLLAKICALLRGCLPPKAQTKNEAEIIHGISGRAAQIGSLTGLACPRDAHVRGKFTTNFVAKAQP